MKRIVPRVFPARKRPDRNNIFGIFPKKRFNPRVSLRFPRFARREQIGGLLSSEAHEDHTMSHDGSRGPHDVSRWLTRTTRCRKRFGRADTTSPGSLVRVATIKAGLALLNN
eukprot:1192323-Prorocentrum_minimum.AAC.2